jgi:hypothetical protein
MFVLKTLIKKEKGIKHPKSYERRAINKKYVTGVTTQLKNDDLQKVKILVSALYDCLKVYGYGGKRSLLFSDEEIQSHNLKTKKDKARLVNRYYQFVEKAGYGSWKDLFKYKINAFFSHIFEQTIPPAPKGLEEFLDLVDPSFMFYGRAKRFLYIMKNDVLKEQFALSCMGCTHRSFKIESFAQTVAQSKKGAGAMHKDLIAQAEQKTFVHLTSNHPNIPNFVLEGEDNLFPYEISQESIEEQLRRTVREIFGKKSLKMKDISSPLFPSTSSHYNFNRDNMGAVGAFCSNQVIRGFLEEKDLVELRLTDMNLSGELTELYGRAGEADQKEIDEDIENIRVKSTIGLSFNGEKLCELWKSKIYPSLVKEAINELPKTIVLGLAEPLKVRPITAGPPLTQTALKPIQKWLWRVLKKNSVFQLIGTPVTPEIVMKQLGELGFNEEFTSGDYKDSTNNLHSWVSECLADELSLILSENNLTEEEGGIPSEMLSDLMVLMKRILTKHILLNPAYNGDYRQGYHLRPEWFEDQKEGQLMGSVVSFPFLCMANAALCRYALEVSSKKRFRVVDRYIPKHLLAPLLVNGDDCVFRGKVDVLFTNWEKITSFGGLESSVGKTFKSRKFLTINSVCYKYRDPTWQEASGLYEYDLYHQLKYVNLGLVYGQKKNGDTGKGFYQLGAIHRDLARTCPPEYFVQASEMMIKKASKPRYIVQRDDDTGKVIKIDGLPLVKLDFFADIRNSELPWYIPEWLGGLGLVPFKEGCVTTGTLMEAAFIRDRLNSDLSVRKFSDLSTWQMHRMVQSDLSDYRFLDNQNFKFVEKDGEISLLQNEYDRLYNLLVVNQMFGGKTGLCKPPQPSEQIKELFGTLFKNRTVWFTARKTLGENPGLNRYYFANKLQLDDLKSEKKEFALCCFEDRPKRDEENL